MKKLIGLIVVLGILGAGGYWYCRTYGKPEVKPQVTEASVTRGSVAQTVQATGTLDSLRTIDIGTQVTGVVKKLYVDFNYLVKKGQILAELDPDLLQQQVNMGEANLKRADVDIQQKQITLENDQVKLTRQRDLYAAKLVTKEALENAELQVKVDQAQLESSKASRVQTDAQLNQAKTNVGYTIIKAPEDGVITNRATDEGRTVNASTSSPTLYTMATDLQHLKLTASIDESEVANVRPDQNVTFRVDAYAPAMFRGKVVSVHLNAKNSQNVVTYETVINVDNPDLRLKPGMTATLTIEVQRANDVLLVPSSALRFRPTAEMFEILKQPVPPEAQPAAGRAAGAGDATQGGGNGGNGGGRNGRNARNANGNGAAGGGAEAPAEAAPAGAPGAQRGQGQQANGGGRGTGGGNNGQAFGGGGRGGNGAGRMNLTPDQQKKFDAIRNNTKLTQEQKMAEYRKIMPNMGGGRGQGGGGRGQNANANASMSQSGEKTIDQLLPPVQRRELGNQRVWIFVNNQLKAVNGLRTAISNGQLTELVSGDLKEGDKVVTNFVIPGAKVTATPQQQGNPFQQNGGGNRGGGGGRGGF